jgi:N-acetyl-gamma-glutamyl-phosphate reductase
MLSVGIYSVSGYIGGELVRILVNHPKIVLKKLFVRQPSSLPLSAIFPQFEGKIKSMCERFTLKAAQKLDLLFLTLPSGVAMKIVPQLQNSSLRIIDLSADHRLPRRVLYQKWYHLDHPNPSLLKKVPYGLPEVFKKEIKKATLVANPGCYPTASLLAILPLISEVDEKEEIIIEAKSGISGAGRKPRPDLHFPECNEDIIPYNVFQHRHIPEMEEVLKKFHSSLPPLLFTPQIIPVSRGILTTVYLSLKRNLSQKQIFTRYKTFYQNAPFVQLLPEGKYPNLKAVRNTNYCLLSIAYPKQGRRIAIFSALDNLVKGGAGQAVQNMNLMFGFPEEEGLNNLPYIC